MEAEEKPSPFRSYCQSWGCSWAQHNIAKPLPTSKKIHIFQPLVGNTAELVPWGKDLPKREVFQLGKGPVASQGQEEGDHGQEPGQSNVTSWQPPQGPEDTTKLFGGFGTCILLLWGSFEQLITFLGTTSPDASNSQKPCAKGTDRILTSHQTLKCHSNATGKVCSSF